MLRAIKPPLFFIFIFKVLLIFIHLYFAFQLRMNVFGNHYSIEFKDPPSAKTKFVIMWDARNYNSNIQHFQALKCTIYSNRTVKVLLVQLFDYIILTEQSHNHSNTFVCG